MRGCLLILVTFLSASLFCQNETNNWYFGKQAGLNFASKIPQILLDGRMIAPAGCASISDLNGNLLFYTDGNIVWNKNHIIMVNGFQIGGDIEATQNSMIVPIADNTGIYYIFSVGFGGLSYSIVDVNSNGGLGEVIEKNNILILGKEVGKISAVHHGDGKSIWVMTTKMNENDEYTSFYAYKVNANGSIDIPVISSNELRYNGVVEGAMKFSPNGKRIACGNYRTDKLANHLMVFDFDNQTGIVSRKRDLATSFVQFEVVSAYGVEFSNDSRYLYVALIRQGKLNPENIKEFQDTIKKNLLYQYDLNNLNPWGSITSLNEDSSNLAASSLQLSKDGKIYRALCESGDKGTKFLGVINNPNILGNESNYVHNSFNLIDKESRLGLPNFIQSYFRTRILNDEACAKNDIFFEVDTYAKISTAQWDFGDGNISSAISPKHIYISQGSYNVSVTITINNRQITVSKNISIHGLPDLVENQELIQCDTDTDGISNFNLYNIREKITNPNLNETLFFYEKEVDAKQDLNRILNPSHFTNTIPNQEIFVRVVNAKGCFETTSFFISATFLELGEIFDMYICDGSNGVLGDMTGRFALHFKKDEIRNNLNLSNSIVLKFYPTLLDAQTTQNELIKHVETASTTIWVRAEASDLACNGLSPINLIVNNEQPAIHFEDNYNICRGAPITLLGDDFNDRYEWLNSDGKIISTQQQYTFTTSGIFTYIAYKSENGLECSSSKEIIIKKPKAPIFNAIEVIEGSNTNTISVSVEGDDIYEFSINNKDFFANTNTYVFSNVPPGIHIIYVRDQNRCGTTIQKQVYVMGYPKFFTPNNDGINDFWKIKGLDENLYTSITIKIFDRYGKFITTLTNKNNHSWDGIFNGEKLPPNDYWFNIALIDTNNITVQKRGHFSLVR